MPTRLEKRHRWCWLAHPLGRRSNGIAGAHHQGTAAFSAGLACRLAGCLRYHILGDLAVAGFEPVVWVRSPQQFQPMLNLGESNQVPEVSGIVEVPLGPTRPELHGQQGFRGRHPHYQRISLKHHLPAHLFVGHETHQGHLGKDRPNRREVPLARAMAGLSVGLDTQSRFGRIEMGSKN